MTDSLPDLLDIAREAALAAVSVHHRAATGASTKGSPTDLVTDIDREAEQRLVAVIRKYRPDDSIVGEEGAAIKGSSGVCWILDPLDGTTNFVYGYPAHAVAVGVEIDGERALGLVHDTSRSCVYSGIVGQGAYCDYRPIFARTSNDLSHALIGTGFLPQAAVRDVQGGVLRYVLPKVRDVRRSGCPSLDLCAVAAGMLDGFYEFGLGRWDIAAGAAIAEAAGASIALLAGKPLPDPLLVAANPGLLPELLGLLDLALLEQVVDPQGR